MAKARHDQPPESNKNTLIIMAVGGLLVAALVVWALTRTVEPAPATFPAGATPVAGGTTAPPPLAASDTGFPAITTATTGVNPNPLSPNPAAPTPAAAPQGDRADVRRIAVEDLKAQVDRGGVTVIDVRDAASFATAHIPGALNMPFASIEAQADAIPKGKPIVTYCT